MHNAISNDERSGSSIFQRDPSYLETLGVEFDDMAVRTPVLPVRVWPRHEKNWQQKRLRRVGFQVERDKVQLAWEEHLKAEEEWTVKYLESVRAALARCAHNTTMEL